MREACRKMKTVSIVFAASFLTYGLDSSATTEVEKAEMLVSGISGVSYGQIVKGLSVGTAQLSDRSGRPQLENEVLVGWDLWLDLEVSLTQRVHGFLGGGGLINYDVYAKQSDNPERRLLQTKGSFFGITKTYLRFDLMVGEPLNLQLSAGYFPFKYSPDVKNLGEYLYRTEVYPNIVFTGGLDNSAPSVLGLRLRSVYASWLSNDFLITTETETHPFFDLSLSDIVTLKAGELAEFGVGGSLWRLLPADGKATSPGDNLSWEDLKELEESRDRTTFQYMYWDSSKANPDTTVFTMQGAKVIGRFSLNPGSLIAWPRLGQNDLRLYAEAALLGVKDYPHFYDDKLKRIPVMVGFNFPTLKLLDVLAIELEQHLFDYSNTTVHKNQHNSPLPEQLITRQFPTEEARRQREKIKHIFEVEDNFKWSIYFKKVLGDHFQIQGQFAKDHLRLPDYEGVISDRPNFEAYGDWYYQLKMQYFF